MRMPSKLFINEITPNQWTQEARTFGDYSIYQTWPYQQVRADRDGQEINRVRVYDKEGRTELLCQTRIKRIRPLGLRVGYIQWGPLVCDKDGSLRCSAQALQRLRDYYLTNHVHILRVVPNIEDNGNGQRLRELLLLSDFEPCRRIPPYHTQIISLEASEEDLRQGLHQSWRRKLRKAEKAGIRLAYHTDEDTLHIMDRLYREMVQRKGIRALDFEQFRGPQRLLDPDERIDQIVAYYQGQPVTSLVCSNLGQNGILLMVASDDTGLACHSSYLVWWDSLLQSQRKGMRDYDVGGIDFEHNPHVSRFKAGLGGRNCRHLGTFDAYASRLVKVRWGLAEKTYHLIKA